MHQPFRDKPETAGNSLGDLFQRLKESGTAALRAEVKLAREVIVNRAQASSRSIMLILAGAMLVSVAGIVLAIALLLALAILIGPLIAGALLFALLALAGLALISAGRRGLKQQAALAANEDMRTLRLEGE